jgi:hypothetical protein
MPHNSPAAPEAGKPCKATLKDPTLKEMEGIHAHGAA